MNPLGPHSVPWLSDPQTFRHFEDFDDATCEDLLKPMKAINALGLRGCPVSETKMAELVRRFELEHLDAVDCGLTDAAARRLAASFPDLRLLPNVAALDAHAGEGGDDG